MSKINNIPFFLQNHKNSATLNPMIIKAAQDPSGISYFNLGMSSKKHRDIDNLRNALEYFYLAQSLNPKIIAADREIGYVLCDIGIILKNSNIEEAKQYFLSSIEYLKKALINNVGDTDIYLYLGHNNFELGDFREAIGCYNERMYRMPDDTYIAEYINKARLALSKSQGPKQFYSYASESAKSAIPIEAREIIHDNVIAEIVVESSEKKHELLENMLLENILARLYQNPIIRAEIDKLGSFFKHVLKTSQALDNAKDLENVILLFKQNKIAQELSAKLSDKLDKKLDTKEADAENPGESGQDVLPGNKPEQEQQQMSKERTSTEASAIDSNPSLPLSIFQSHLNIGGNVSSAVTSNLSARLLTEEEWEREAREESLLFWEKMSKQNIQVQREQRKLTE